MGLREKKRRGFEFTNNIKYLFQKAEASLRSSVFTHFGKKF